MQRVAHHLQLEAMKKQGEERDLYARSAYNRYYYNLFLIVRQMLADLDPIWSELPHKDYPKILKGQICRTYRKSKARAQKNGDSGLVQKLDDGLRAASALASLMTAAYVIRIVADYKPAEKIIFESQDRFSLKNINITEAHNWRASAQLWTNSIKDAWSQIK